ncbi:RrF2 family transcriptional regulator [Streptomyces sp. NPDC004065]|uniref:RrF2 family transcriptional regulator n=1 Tax=Streptomyces sp. NPDC004065 TaxID=3364689 RepID=UPI00384C5DD6
MKLREGVEWAVHCCINLSWISHDRAVPAAKLAEFHDLPTAYLNKQMHALGRAGIVSSRSGPRGGYRLGRRPEEISLMDVAVAIDGSAQAFLCTGIRHRGPAGRITGSAGRPAGPDGHRAGPDGHRAGPDDRSTGPHGRSAGPDVIGADVRGTPCTVAQAFSTAELAWRRRLAEQTIADLADAVRRANPAAPDRVRQWFDQN